MSSPVTQCDLEKWSSEKCNAQVQCLYIGPLVGPVPDDVIFKIVTGSQGYLITWHTHTHSLTHSLTHAEQLNTATGRLLNISEAHAHVGTDAFSAVTLHFACRRRRGNRAKTSHLFSEPVAICVHWRDTISTTRNVCTNKLQVRALLWTVFSGNNKYISEENAVFTPSTVTTPRECTHGEASGARILNHSCAAMQRYRCKTIQWGEKKKKKNLNRAPAWKFDCQKHI